MNTVLDFLVNILDKILIKIVIISISSGVIHNIVIDISFCVVV